MRSLLTPKTARGLTVVVAAAAAAVVSLHPWAPTATGSASLSPSGSPAPVFGSTTSPSIPDPKQTSAVPTDVVEAVAVHGVTFADPAESVRAPTVSAQDATDAARAAVGLDGRAAAATITLASVTTKEYGTEMQPDPRLPSQIEPALNGRVAWVITFPSVTVPINGKVGYTGPATGTGPLLALVDPYTGEFLYGIAY